MLRTAQDRHQKAAREFQGKLDAERSARVAAESKLRQLHKRVHAWKEGYVARRAECQAYHACASFSGDTVLRSTEYIPAVGF